MRPSQPHLAHHGKKHPGMATLMLGTLGVVYGDIGTSPLYTLRECFHTAGLPLNSINIFGILSLISWSLLLVVTLKYVSFILRADNQGEGGILALIALAQSKFSPAEHATVVPYVKSSLLFLGLAGAALFYGDAVITPAISVLSAVEGLTVINPVLQPLVIPITLLLLVGLFVLQKYGTQTVGEFFGPIMLVWFGVIGIFGFFGILDHPAILAALNPWHAVQFMLTNKLAGFLTMGAVVLAITGGEALYADLGHFGRLPIQRSWLLLVGPALILNYFGQGAMVLTSPGYIENPFFLLAPQELRVALIILAAIATVIASQSVISGAFSLTRQAMQLGYLPRLDVRHTSAHQAGQIYLPALNTLMLITVILIVLAFRSSDALAAAYGIAVTGTMGITTLLATGVLYRKMHWPLWAVAGFGVSFLTVDLIFLAANLPKVSSGGWLPLAIAAGLLYIMRTWIKGRSVTFQRIYANTRGLYPFLQELPNQIQQAVTDPAEHPLFRPDRSAVYLTADLDAVPLALAYNLKHNRVLHQQVVLLKVDRAATPFVPASQRYEVHLLPHGFQTLRITYGFMESPNIPAALNEASAHYGLPFCHRHDSSYFLSTHSYVPSSPDTLNSGGLNRFEEPVYMLLEAVSSSAARFCRLPRSQVVEIGDYQEL